MLGKDISINVLDSACLTEEQGRSAVYKLARKS
jgi:hypothetical protein